LYNRRRPETIHVLLTYCGGKPLRYCDSDQQKADRTLMDASHTATTPHPSSRRGDDPGGGGGTVAELPPPAVAAPRSASSSRTSLKARALMGSGWVGGGYIAVQGLRFVSMMVLTYLLAPDVFGVMTMINVFLQGLEMFSDIGIGPSIIHSKRGEKSEFLNTAWTMQVIRGFVLWG